MERRPTRARNKATNVAENFEMDVDYASEPDEEFTEKKRSKKRKTLDKSNTKAVEGQSSTKKIRGRRGILKHLVEMPMDVLFEIFGQLSPLDILNLARTTKDLRAILMSRSSVSVWKRARGNVEGFPDCPDDLSEPEYAELAFGKSCYFCRRNHATNIIAWEARFRTCTKCLHTRDGFTPPVGRATYPQALYDRIPRCPVAIKRGRSVSRCVNIYWGLHSKWSEEHKALPEEERDGWLKKKLSERRAIRTHAEACTQWMSEAIFTRIQEKESLKDERRAIIRERIKKLGWGDELEKTKTSQELTNDSVISKACQKEVTEKVLTNLEEYLNRFMTCLRDSRLERERSSTFKERLQLVAKIREECVAALPINSIVPCSADLFNLPAVHDVIMDTLPCDDFTPREFDFIRESFSELCLQWQHLIRGKLFDMIKKSSLKDYDPETVLHLATTSFKCKGCETFIEYPRILVHKCATFQIYEAPSRIEAVVESVFRESRWNAVNYISFDPAQFEAAAKVLKLCGLDPHMTETDDIDALDPVFECLSCNSLIQGRMTMDWRAAALHYLSTSEHRSEPNIQLMNEGETAKVKERMLEEVERAQSVSRSQSYICMHCGIKDNLMMLKHHVRQVHGKQNPTDEDVVLQIREFRQRAPYWLWPPRMD